MEEPLIPLGNCLPTPSFTVTKQAGCGLTAWALISASRSIRRGTPEKTNMMFRRRIYAQLFTIAAMVGGSFYYEGDRAKRREFEKLVAEKKAKEKNEAWIKELEWREKEEETMQLESKKLRQVAERRRKDYEKNERDRAEKKNAKGGSLDIVEKVKSLEGEGESSKEDAGSLPQTVAEVVRK